MPTIDVRCPCCKGEWFVHPARFNLSTASKTFGFVDGGPDRLSCLRCGTVFWYDDAGLNVEPGPAKGMRNVDPTVLPTGK